MSVKVRELVLILTGHHFQIVELKTAGSGDSER